MKWGITGASGQLGHEIEELLGTSQSANKFWHDGELDITDEGAIDLIVEAQPDVLVNCAAWTAVEKAETDEANALRVNQLGALNMARAAKNLQIPFVQISTDYVFSGDNNVPWRVSDRPEPKSAYGRSKLAGEIAVQEIYPEQSYIVRTAWLYSRHGSNFPKTIIRKLLNSTETLEVVADQFGQPTSAKDLARQITKLVENRLPYGIYHASNSGMTTWFGFAQRILGCMGQAPSRISPVSSSEYPSRVERPAFSVLDHSEWSTTNLSPMRNWESAFDENFPEILESVKAELQNG